MDPVRSLPGRPPISKLKIDTMLSPYISITARKNNSLELFFAEDF